MGGIDGDADDCLSICKGSAYINENNTISYSASSAGSDLINYTVQDIFGNTAQANVFVDIFGGGGGGGGGGGYTNTAPTGENRKLKKELFILACNKFPLNPINTLQDAVLGSHTMFNKTL